MAASSNEETIVYLLQKIRSLDMKVNDHAHLEDASRRRPPRDVSQFSIYEMHHKGTR